MKKYCLVLLFFSALAFGQEKLINMPIEGRQDDFAPVLENLVAPSAINLLLIPGGNAGTGEVINGMPTSQNFLVRSRQDFQGSGFNTFILFRPKSVAPGSMSFNYRIQQSHLEEIKSLINYISKNTSGPIWIVGTSMGTISAASAAINIDNPRVKGIVLTASVTRDAPGNLYSQSLSKIMVPVLMIHHETDQCFACVPSEAKELIHDFKSSPKKEFLMVGGGGPPSGDPCQNKHWHGFVGIENKVTKDISDWIKKNNK